MSTPRIRRRLGPPHTAMVSPSSVAPVAVAADTGPVGSRDGGLDFCAANGLSSK